MTAFEPEEEHHLNRERHPKLTVIILNHNGWTQNRRVLIECVRNSLSVDVDNEVIFVDNGSTDDSLQSIRGIFHDQLNYVSSAVNLGYGAGMNLGAKSASQTSKYLFFVNNDVVFSCKAVLGLIKFLEANPNIAVAGCTEVFQNRDTGPGGSFLNMRLIHRRPPTATNSYYVTMVENFFVVRKEVYAYLGGFDHAFFQVWDEADLCLRAWFSGHSVATNPGLRVVHLHNLPNKKSYGRLFRHTRNKYLVMIKLYSLRYLTLYLPLSLFSDVWKSIVDDEWRKFGGIEITAKAILDVLLNFRGYYQSRVLFCCKKKVSERYLIKKGILWR